MDKMREAMLADALETADWSNVCIGNKVLISGAIATLRHEAAAPVEDDTLPCDVKLPPATTIRAGCKVSTLLFALNVADRPMHFTSDLTSRLAEAERENERLRVENRKLRRDRAMKDVMFR